jgi:hypothetical protein
MVCCCGADIAAVSIDHCKQRYAELRGYRPHGYFFDADCTEACGQQWMASTRGRPLASEMTSIAIEELFFTSARR